MMPMTRLDIEIDAVEQTDLDEWAERLARLRELDPADVVEEAGALADHLTAVLDAEEGGLAD